MNKNVIIYTDGGSRGNPGEAAYGFFISDAEKKEIAKVGRRLGIKTNNYAEYMAVISALRWIQENYKPYPSKIDIYLDSQLIERQMKGQYKIKEETLRSLFFTAHELMRSLGSEITFTHVPREQNKIADSMVNAALDNKI